MVVRRRRKLNVLRGERTHGHGNKKNRRGGGSRGGIGKGGSHKHKFSKYYLDFGTKRVLKKQPRPMAIDLDDLQKGIPTWLEKKLVEKHGSAVHIDGDKIGYGKILSRGAVKEKLTIKNMTVSAKAKEKIESAGGKIEGLEKSAAAFAEEEFEEEEFEAGKKEGEK